MEKLLLTPEEAAEVLSIGRTKVYALMAGGALVSVRIGNSRRIPLYEVTEFVARLDEEARLAPRAPARLVAR